MGNIFGLEGQLPPITTAVEPLLRIVSLRSDTEDRWLLMHFVDLPTDFRIGLAYS